MDNQTKILATDITVDEQISKLNSEVKCRLAPSKIHGVGVFAIRNVKKGEKLYCQSEQREWMTVPFLRFGEIGSVVKDLILDRWPKVKDGGVFLSPNDDARLVSFMNHCEAPNYDSHKDEALFDILKGEEVVEDYNKL